MTSETILGTSAIERLVADRVGGKRGVGIVAGLIDRDSQECILNYGDAGAEEPVETTSVFELGSLTKVFTGTLLAEMVLRGEARLEDPVASYLPETVQVPADGEREIELFDLATHTSGLPRLPFNWKGSDGGNPLADYTVEKPYNFLASFTLPRAIGGEYEYSNTGFGLLGHALALRAGDGYEALLVDRILEPLGMTMTGATLTGAMKKDLAVPHDEQGDVVPISEFGVLAGSGTVRSNLLDMLAFACAHLEPDTGRLGDAIAAALIPRRTVNDSTRIGLGWHIRRLFDRDVVWHGGETAGSRSFIALDLERHEAVVLLSNSAASITDLGFHLLDERVPLSRERGEIELDDGVLERYVGVFELSDGQVVTVTRTESGLAAEATGLGAAPIYPSTETEFFVKVIPIELAFELDPRGGATALTMRFQGKELRGKKVA